MRFDTSMQTRLEQRMKLAPRMIQSMEILQLPLMALEERIQEELVANPVLEIKESDDLPGPPTPAENHEEPAPQPVTPEEERPLKLDDAGSAEEFDRLDAVADQWDDMSQDQYAPRVRTSSDDANTKMDALQNSAAPGEDLREVLLEQFAFFSADPVTREIGRTIIQNLDDNGYLRVPLDEIVRDVQVQAAPEQAEAALKLVQRLDPPGVGARDLKECLLIQIDRGVAGDQLTRQIIQNHLHDIENNRYPQVARALGVDIEDIKEAVAEIRHLNPKPGASISNELVPYVVPDVEIAFDEESQDYRVRVIDDRTPALRISAVYRKMLKNHGLDRLTREFVARNVRSARWLIDAIEQRRNTLLRVVQAIVKFQRPFLDLGPQHVGPLKMQQVADEVGLHVGTISRAVDDKYAETPWGMFALRNFFTGGTETASGETIAWDNVRTRLRAMIDSEDKSSPLSDEDLVERFKAEGVELARRTVAKYRKIMKIPSSRRRKEF